MNARINPARAAIVLGTRPEIIKLAGVIDGLGERGYVVHSGQHFDDELSAQFFADYDLPPPEVRLAGVGGVDRAGQFAEILRQLTAAFTADRPGAVIVQGDTNTAAAGAMAASFLDIPTVHVEAGLRSYDRAMPEEINRQLIGVVAELHCAPTPLSGAQLVAEGVPSERILLTGNTVVEATRMMLPDDAARDAALAAHQVTAGDYVLATIHRPENTDDADRLSVIMTALANLPCPVLLPLHPRTRAAIERAGLESLLTGMRVVAPLDHPTFLALASRARLLVSDSGGVQEECTVLKRPLVVLRNSTERPEAIDAGFARRWIPGPDLPELLAAAVADQDWGDGLATVSSPYGDGTASAAIVAAVLRMLDTAEIDFCVGARAR
ncbi:non-hydrolyzing UDP-N-acetylglucosamine 2-epimerase [Nocardioides sp. AE5]|uniref:non-hydrolyzing UDP-N-acetylglucosamine 2-epimerase n=1 Tax=Nocardioides sp. AE5 TaxID=2962573 RepID=UPI0028823D97|nr:UDP-N-acetylglucosamine 2-epimerase (non-hydrolyzing) [Nocardioides sp. AE5]MDT0203429.1 UDP-N-acetylglucosamine 2-epimerase (non-hydrolyzing) [Nocardioides sp. AE5]